MRADVLQAVAICCHGNAFLASKGDHAPELLGHNRTFRGVEELVFERKPVGFSTSSGTMPVATGTAPWLRRLRHEGVERLELRLAKCVLDATKQDSAGEWGITSDGDIGVELWQPAWKARIIAFGEPPVWRTRYTAERIQRWALQPTAGISRANEMMTAALNQALAFCREHAPSNMRVPLERCIELHHEGRREAPGFPCLFSQDLPDENKRLLSTAVTSVLVISSPVWDKQALVQEVHSDFLLLTQLIWKCSLTSFESAVNSWSLSEPKLSQAG